MNFLSMDYFLMTAEKRSFTKAADALHHPADPEHHRQSGTGTGLQALRPPCSELTYAGEIFWQYAVDFRKYRACSTNLPT